MTLDLQQISEIVGSADRPPAVLVKGWSIDTRTLNEGEVYIALKGEVHDGHDFVNAAFERGAIAALMSRDREGAVVIRVPDTLKALQQLATWARSKWAGQIIVV